MKTDGGYYRLTYRGAALGPGFPSKASAAAFVQWLEARSGLEWHQQSHDSLARLQALWAKSSDLNRE